MELFVVDGTYVFSHVFILLSFADFSCLSQCVFTPGRPCPESKGVKLVV